MPELRDAIAAAFNKSAEKDEDLVDSTESTADSSQSTTDTSATQDTSNDLPTLAPDKVATEEKDSSIEEPEQKKAAQKVDGQKDKTSAVEVSTQDVKPPQSWKPAAREHWNKIPAEARAEIQRREKEIQQGLSQSAHARKFGDEFFKVMSPYEGLLRAQGATPLGAVQNLMQTVAGLSMGSTQQKAGLVAGIIKNYGIDIEALSQLLAGAQPKQEDDVTDRVMQRVQQAIAPIQQHIQGQSAQQRHQDAVGEAAAVEFVTEFISDPQNEFAEDLREDMADLLDASARRGKKMTIQQAYKLACDADPSISKIIEQRKAAASKSGVNRRDAASSLRRSGPNGTDPGTPSDLRGAVAAAFEKHTH